MTRFQREITGALGPRWKEDAERRIKKYVLQAQSETFIESDGAICWISSGRYLMDDYCEILEYAGYPFSREATTIKRCIQVAKELANYKRSYEGPSAEMIAEIKSTFGKDVKITNVLTGTSINIT